MGDIPVGSEFAAEFELARQQLSHFR
jgi:hypothetical protein